MKNIPSYDPAAVEAKWQKHWAENHSFAAERSHDKPKFYPMTELPSPSGEGMNVSQPRSITAMDIIARKRRMEGYNVLFPVVYEAFGLPAENYAIEHHIHPAAVAKENIERLRRQLQRLGFSFDYDREISTDDLRYYKWTQWIFLKLFERGLIYREEMPAYWCPSCKAGLENCEAIGGIRKYCKHKLIRKVKSQWMLRISDYAQKLIDGLETVDYDERVKVQQRSRIGSRSEGVELDFQLSSGDALSVYIARPHMLFGATCMVISPEHPLIEQRRELIRNYAEIAACRDAAAHKSNFERTMFYRVKTGVAIDGITATNPVNGAQIPIWVSEYVLMDYGTGAIMAVPAHDERFWEFARKSGLPIVEVVAGGNVDEAAYTDIQDGVLVNSGFLNGMKVPEAKEAITDYLVSKGIGRRKIDDKLYDREFSRKRGWGVPIPLVNCPCCGWVALPCEQLPLELPEVESYEPTDDGESPLAAMTDWVNTTCPKCGGPAKRETDTMPEWAGSSWYFLRCIDPENDSELAAMDEMKYWLPVDWYNSDMERDAQYLLYTRFWHRFLYDIGVAPTPEPYRKHSVNGKIRYSRMSLYRSFLDHVVDDLGADAFRLNEMFMSAFDREGEWPGVAEGCRRFLNSVWHLMKRMTDEEGISEDMKYAVNFCIRKVGEDYEAMRFNSAIEAMKSLVNGFYAKRSVTRGEMRVLVQLLNPVAPHITEEINELCHLNDCELIRNAWPAYDESALLAPAEEPAPAGAAVEIALHVNGKLRGRMNVPADLTREAASEYLLAQDELRKLIGDRPVKRLIFVPGRLVNIVI